MNRLVALFVSFALGFHLHAQGENILTSELPSLHLVEGSRTEVQKILVDEKTFVEFRESVCYDEQHAVSLPSGFPRELNALPEFCLGDGVFVGEPNSVKVSASHSVMKVNENVFIHENVLSREEALAILQLSKNWTFDYERKSKFHAAHVNITHFPLNVAVRGDLKRRLGEVLGTRPDSLRDIVPLKRISTHENLPSHVDNAGVTDATVILYFQDLNSGGLAFPATNLAILPRIGRAVVLITRSPQGEVDWTNVHHTMKFSPAVEEADNAFRLSLAISIKVLRGFDADWLRAPHLVKEKRAAGYCTGHCVSVSPTNSPTDSPVTNPTDSPVANPTDSPVTNPTDSPVTNPTDSSDPCRRTARSREECAQMSGCRFVSPGGRRFSKLSEKTIEYCRAIGDFGCRSVANCSFKCKRVCLADAVCRRSC